MNTPPNPDDDFDPNEPVYQAIGVDFGETFVTDVRIIATQPDGTHIYRIPDEYEDIDDDEL